MAMIEGDGRCYAHSFERAESRCRNCGYEYCSECLVYAFGSNRPPYCIACALAASGVRSNAARQPALSRRELRQYEKDRKKAAKAAVQPAARVEVQAAWTPPPEPSPPAAPTDEDDPFAWADRPSQRVPF